jgi:hypothetical protein
MTKSYLPLVIVAATILWVGLAFVVRLLGFTNLGQIDTKGVTLAAALFALIGTYAHHVNRRLDEIQSMEAAASILERLHSRIAAAQRLVMLLIVLYVASLVCGAVAVFAGQLSASASSWLTALFLAGFLLSLCSLLLLRSVHAQANGFVMQLRSQKALELERKQHAEWVASIREQKFDVPPTKHLDAPRI